MQKEFEEFIILNVRSINCYTSLSIRDHLLGRNKTEEPTVIDYIDKFYATAVENNANLAACTIRTLCQGHTPLKELSSEKEKRTLVC